MIRAMLIVVAAGLLGLAALASGGVEQGWTIERFRADITIADDGSLDVIETVDVNFSVAKHGIFRDIPVEYDYDHDSRRVYRLDVRSVTGEGGESWPWKTSREGPNLRVKIGDPDRTLTGRRTYRIAYRVRDVLNGFPDHDELYWNAFGSGWPVEAKEVSATVVSAGGGLERAACYEGGYGATDPCPLLLRADRAGFAATRPLRPGESLTIVTALRKGVVPEPAIRLKDVGPREVRDYFSVTPVTVGLAALGAAGALGFGAASWWRNGRDRVYRTLYYLSRDPAEMTRPLFHRADIVVEYEPPDGLRPAQMGLLLDERVDGKDLTATIIDMAVRGYLTITELPAEGIFARSDWIIYRKRDPDDLKPYERAIFKGLLGDRDEVQLSNLYTDYGSAIQKAQRLLYEGAGRHWFFGSPERVRNRWQIIGLGTAAAGGALTAILAYGANWGLVGLPAMLAGALLAVGARWMPRRTAAGSELMRRILGFRRYIETAETDRLKFAERAQIFAEYLPYAIIFGSVNKWARVFADVDTVAVTKSWYVGTASFATIDFSHRLEGFSTSVTNTIAAPGITGASGFAGGGFGGGGGGSAGGGGGGGGGGSW